MSNAKPLTISAVMPVYNGRGFLEQSLPPLAAMLARGELLEIVVADDGSTDGSGDFCRAHGAQVVTTGGRKGPAAARNAATSWCTTTPPAGCSAPWETRASRRCSAPTTTPRRGPPSRAST
jgi:GT2 family glycosyltransferase